MRRGLALGSGPDEKVAMRLYVSTRPQCKAVAAAMGRRERPDPIERRLRRGQSAVRGDAADARAQ